MSSESQYYELSHQDILLVDQEFVIPVSVHYIQSNIWNEIQKNDSDIIIYNPHPDLPMNMSMLKLLAENRTISNDANQVQYTFSTHNKIDNRQLRDSYSSQMEIWLEFNQYIDNQVLVLPTQDDLIGYNNLTEIKLSFTDHWGFDSSCYIGKEHLEGKNKFSEINQMIVEFSDVITHHWVTEGNISAHRLYFESELMGDFFRKSEQGTLEGMTAPLIFAYIVLQFAILYIMNKIIQSYKFDFRLYYQRGFSMRKNKIRFWKKIIVHPLLLISIIEGLVLQLILYFTISEAQTFLQIYFLFVSWFLTQFLASSFLALRIFRKFEVLSYGLNIKRNNILPFSRLAKLATGILVLFGIFSFFTDLWLIGGNQVYIFLIPIMGILLIGIFLNSLLNRVILKSNSFYSKMLLLRIDKYKPLIMTVIVMMIVFQLMIIPMTPVNTEEPEISDYTNLLVGIQNIQNGDILNYDYSKIEGIRSYFPRLELIKCNDT